jgi:DNA polymerase-3 subunit delta
MIACSRGRLPRMDLLALLDAVDRGEFAPVYFVHGKERFLVEQLVAKLRAALVTGPMAGFNFRRFGKEASGAEISAEARAVPMMASHRLVVVDDTDKLDAADWEALEGYLTAPAAETTLVFVADKFDLRRSVFSRANKRKEPLTDRSLPAFVRSRAKERGVELGPGADSAIAAAVGADAAAIDDAVVRLGLYAGPDGTAREEDVAEVVTSVRQRSVFELVDAIGGRKRADAVALLARLLAAREEPLRLLALLARHYRQLLAARIETHRGAGEAEIASKLGVHPFVAKKLAAQCGRFRGAQLETALARLARADLDLKSSRRPANLILEEAVIGLALGA